MHLSANPQEIARVKSIVNRAVDKLKVTEGLTGMRVGVDVDPY